MFNAKKTFVVTIALVVGALHFVVGPNYKGPFSPFVSGYLIDILLPFVLYFLIAITGYVKSKWLIGLLVFAVGFTVETLQYFNIPIFGSTFDPLDYGMYALGALSGVVVDSVYFSKLNPQEHD